MKEIKLSPLGDGAVRIEFEQTVSLQVNERVQALARSIQISPFQGFIELVPAYTTVTVYYDPLRINYEKVVNELRSRIKTCGDSFTNKQRVITIPVLYGGDAGPDLSRVADVHGLSVDEVIKQHSHPTYYVYMLGFSPGFPYLGGLSNTLATPRRDEPRAKVKAGSIGIAGKQTGIYSVTSPGGWQIIGHTPVKLFDTTSDPLFLIEAGDKIKFIPIEEERYKEILAEVKDGTYKPEITIKEGRSS
ncbi:5-oxoprolinase subunit PxpB [Bacillus shivajii]|uniref:5-oxoprolinase subunit PxpB n=1 Tax=Bacillus shivajii TaxID=1983719 RepID=UPI001CFA0AF4|nr:5-oxoprolinase subunit PxpB [Bacillus shivajii]UCZ53108.1 5-oxoprolinase subunit PxpB [Bacillus shivajii]